MSFSIREELFPTPVTITPPSLPVLKNARIEFYDNLMPPPRGRTQYGLLIDIDYSKFRYNVNFFDRDDLDGVKFIQNGFHEEEFDHEAQSVILRMFEVYKMLNPLLDVSMAHGKLNKLSGKKHPTTSKPLYELEDDFRIWALIVRNSFTPSVYLFYGEDTYSLDSYGWEKPQSDKNKQLKWVNKLNY